MKGWSQFEVCTDYPKHHREIAFSFVKNVEARTDCKRWFYTAWVEYNVWFICFRFEDLKNPKEIVDYINTTFKDDKDLFELKLSSYQRNHVLPMIIAATKISVERETLLTPSALFYLMHCVAMTSFLTPGQRARIWLDLLSDEERKLYHEYLEKGKA